MKRTSLRALVALAIAGAAALAAVKARERRRELSAGPLVTDPLISDPPEEVFAERNMADVATGEGMPDIG
jgi:hypothetical protein